MRHATIVAGLLAAVCSQPVAAACNKDAFEPDFGAPTGGVLVGGTSQQRNFCDNAEDWMSIPVCPGRAYSLDTSALGAAADTLIELYAPDGTSLMYVDDDAAPDPAGHLAWTASSGGTFHARVTQRDGSHGDLRDYRIQLTGDTSPCGTDVTPVVPVSDESLLFNAIAQSVDGGFVAVGGSRSGADVPALTATRWNIDGTIGWVRKIGDGTVQAGKKVVRTADGGFVTLAHSTGPQSSLIAKFTDGGAVDWQRHYGAGIGDSLEGIAASPDGSVYAAGYLGTAGGIDGWLMKLNATGAPDWSIRVGGALGEFFFDVQALVNGGAVAVGSTKTAEGTEDGFFVEVNAASVVVKQVSFHTDAPLTYFEAVHPLVDGGYLVGGTYCPAGLPCRAILLKITAAGAIAWQRFLAWPGGGDGHVMSIDTFPDGSIYAHVVRSRGFDEPISTRWNANGTLLWQSSLGAVNGGLHGVVSNDGGIAVAYGDQPNMRLARIYPTGNTPYCTLAPPAGAIPGLPTLVASASSRGTGNLGEPAPSANFAITSSTRSVASMCCSRVLGPPIFVAGKVNTAISWANDGFGPYDLVRGDLATLKATGGDFTAALDAIPSSQQCLAQGVSEPLVVDSYDQPLPGMGYFYLVRGGTGACPTLYDESAHQLGARDAEITAASGPCP